MKEFKVVNKPEQEIEKIVCDRCKLESLRQKSGIHAGVHPYIDTVSIYWGYGSTYDQELWEYDLCQNCITEIFQDVKKSVYMNEAGPEDEDTEDTEDTENEGK